MPLSIRHLVACHSRPDPGTRFNDDGVQIVVLRRLIDVASGMPFYNQVHRSFVNPSTP